MIEQRVIVSPGFSVVAQLVVSKREVVEAFAPTFRRGTEDLRQKTNTFLLFGTGVRFDQTLSVDGHISGGNSI